MPSKRPTIADIAQDLDLSTATVSRALSGRGYVREDVAARIHAKAQELGYPLREETAGSRVLLVASHAALLDLQRSQFTLHVLEGLRERASGLGIEVEVQGYSDPAEIPPMVLDQPKGLLGIILMTVDDATIGLAHSLPCPVVLLNDDDPLMQIDSVAPCNRSAAALAAGHLKALGHRDIMFLTKPGRRTIARRLEGVRDVLGATLRADHILEVEDWTAEAARNRVAEALRSGPGFTAIVAAGDILAAGAIFAIQESGRSVPRDISVIGIDGLPQGEFTAPALTTIAIPMRRIGAEALALVQENARNRQSDQPPVPRKVELGCRLIERASTAAPPL
ncbi:LacI family transcriptional regulator (plasmid) [Gemmobacter fulvus]|uniref:LacI family transcriptional regulator n=1 Tax=Gemmobacter fulvus TaxID=2840474 RepID=A0A975PAT5_9RHOB|nr:LacI family DNA-binding transcriptional regulator [Gemmobacter fulvus]MBT9245998.1 LacI family transcriptional regulator [Gemmobacter fulvus]QWK92233.1 LacI family transcriptional regulator [Gemmobacter fulvus]